MKILSYSFKLYQVYHRWLNYLILLNEVMFKKRHLFTLKINNVLKKIERFKFIEQGGTSFNTDDSYG